MTQTYEQARREAEESLNWPIGKQPLPDHFNAGITIETLRVLLSGPPEQAEPVAWREADLGWLRRLVQRQAYSGHCGEENAEIRARQDNDDRIERVLTALASPIPATEPTGEEVARVLDPRSWSLRDALHALENTEAANGRRMAGMKDDAQLVAPSLTKARAVQALYRRHRNG